VYPSSPYASAQSILANIMADSRGGSPVHPLSEERYFSPRVPSDFERRPQSYDRVRTNRPLLTDQYGRPLPISRDAESWFASQHSEHAYIPQNSAHIITESPAPHQYASPSYVTPTRSHSSNVYLPQLESAALSSLPLTPARSSPPQRAAALQSDAPAPITFSQNTGSGMSPTPHWPSLYPNLSDSKLDYTLLMQPLSLRSTSPASSQSVAGPTSLPMVSRDN
jgi:hypothetical protein